MLLFTVLEHFHLQKIVSRLRETLTFEKASSGSPLDFSRHGRRPLISTLSLFVRRHRTWEPLPSKPCSLSLKCYRLKSSFFYAGKTNIGDSRTKMLDFAKPDEQLRTTHSISDMFDMYVFYNIKLSIWGARYSILAVPNASQGHPMISSM